MSDIIVQKDAMGAYYLRGTDNVIVAQGIKDYSVACKLALAPKMFEALMAYFDFVLHKNQGFSLTEIESEMRAAIAKATGGTND